MKSWQHGRLTAEGIGGKTRLFITAGKNKNTPCTYLRSERSGKVAVALRSVSPGDPVEFETHYTNLEEVDEYGNPKPLPVVDMTGREITPNSYICYSAPASKRNPHNHALEIGKVLELTKVGAIRIRRIVKNGEKLAMDKYSKNETVVNNPFRAIKLPVDDKTIIMWIMQDFEELKGSVTPDGHLF
jgi:hypothetical protein